MKKLYLSFLFLVLTNLAYGQYVHSYEFVVHADSIGKIKGVLQELSSDAITIKSLKGNLVTVKAKTIDKIIVSKKVISLGKSVLYGTGIGVAAGSTAFLTDLDGSVQLFWMTACTASGLVAGTGYGLGSRLLSRKHHFNINNDLLVFQKEFSRLKAFESTE
ncbi:hypothetical protein [Pedobacter ghigonis]|uniref:hypothetical protein n=1 Tax=Pedobacter ghigonis TaxID=2730403 RepID=UPI001589C521|nr:hypothetical protein [Pedobacter ghigonis]